MAKSSGWGRAAIEVILGGGALLLVNDLHKKLAAATAYLGRLEQKLRSEQDRAAQAEAEVASERRLRSAAESRATRAELQFATAQAAHAETKRLLDEARAELSARPPPDSANPPSSPPPKA